MLSLVRNFKKTWGFLGVAAAIFFLPQQVRDVPESAGLWEKAWAMIDRTSALTVLVSAVGFWLLYTEVRPFLKIKKRNPITVHEPLFFESFPVAGDDGKWATGVYCTFVSVAVTNSLSNTLTLRNVAATYSLIGTPVRLPVYRSDIKTTDIRHGEVAFFQIGRFLYKEALGGFRRL